MKIPFLFLLTDKGGYISRKLGLVYWILHVLTFLFLIAPIGSILHLWTIPALLGETTYATSVLAIASAYLGANVLDKDNIKDKDKENVG